MSSTLETLGFPADMASIVTTTTQGLIIIGSAPRGGRTELALAVAAEHADTRGGATAIVTPDAPPAAREADVHWFTAHDCDSELAALHAAFGTGATTIVYDGAPTVEGLAYSMVLARSGVTVLATMPYDEVNLCISIVADSVSRACYEGQTNSERMVWEDVAETLQAVITRADDIDETGRAIEVLRYCPVGDGLRTAILSALT